MARFCQHGNFPDRCPKCRDSSVAEAEERMLRNRARGDVARQVMREEPALHYPWQREAFEAWVECGRYGLVALSHGLPMGDLPFAVIHHTLQMSGDTNVLVACTPEDREGLVATMQERFGLKPSSLLDHHFMEPREDGVLIVADLQELSTVDLSAWGRFATTGLLVLLDADGMTPPLGRAFLEAPFASRFCLSRQPSSFDLLSSQTWARVYGPLLYRYTEAQARDLGILPRIRYRLHVAMLKPENTDDGPVGPWDGSDIPVQLPDSEAGVFARGRARDVALERCKATEDLVVLHPGVPVPGAKATLALKNLPAEHTDGAPAGWLLADPAADGRAIMRIATTAWKTLGEPGLVEDTVVLPVPADLCHTPPWDDRWRQAARQLDRVATGLLLADDPDQAMVVEDLETMVGAALALRGLPGPDLYRLTPVVAQAAALAHAGKKVPPADVLAAIRSHGGLAGALLVAAESGPASLLRLAHPRITPMVPDLPHPSLYDARRHAWRGRTFSVLAAEASKKDGDLVTAWGRYAELRFLFASSHLLEAATSYCKRHRLKGPLDDAALHKVPDISSVKVRGKTAAVKVLQEWSDALSVAEEHERSFLADMHRRQPERERRREGMALPRMHVGHRTPSSVTVEFRGGRMPATNIAPGSEVALVEAGKRVELASGLVSKMSGRRLTIDCPAGLPRNLPDLVTVNLVFDATVFEAYHSAILGALRAAKTREGADDGPDGLLRACLLGETKAAKKRPQKLELDALTESQLASVNAVLAGGRVNLVHGPPGTGKTHTLSHLAIALTRAGHSVLVTADSNAAVDNLVVGLRRAGAPVVRVGHAPNIRDDNALPARIDPLDAPSFVRWAGEHGVVVATTNYGAYRYIDARGTMSPYIFDYVIHDEAGQSTAPSSLAAVMRGRNLVLAGDPLQLPPTVVSMDAKDAGLDVTLFERIEELTGGDRTWLLKTQFRMRDQIARFSNERYYEGAIQTADSADAQDGIENYPALAFRHVTGLENPRQRNGSISNDYEVACIKAVIDDIRTQVRDKGWTMAVLTPYQAQREAIRREVPDVEVSTVDAAQGREWDVVLYSSVRSNPRHRLGFVADERRLNVAVTRARRNFILVGDERTISDHPGFKLYLGLCQKIHVSYGQAAPRPSERQRQPPTGRQGGRGRRGGRGGRGGRGPRHDRGTGSPRGRPDDPDSSPSSSEGEAGNGGRKRGRRRGRSRASDGAPGSEGKSDEGKRSRRTGSETTDNSG